MKTPKTLILEKDQEISTGGAFAFTEIERGARAPLKHMVHSKDCTDGGKGASHHRGTVWIE